MLLQTEELEIDDEANKLADAISSVKLSQVSKLSKFSKGENFSRYCDRFLEYIKISQVRDRNLYLYFLQNMDDETYTILKTAKLTPEEKANGMLFVEIYKRIIYGSEKISLRNEVIDCKQNFDEGVRDYAFRILEKADIAFDDPNTRDENCLMAFLRGVRDTHIKRRKVNSRSRSQDRSHARGRSESADSWRSNSSQGSEEHSVSRGRTRNRSRKGRSPRSYNSREPSRPRWNNKTCWNCNKRGHLQRQCWYRNSQHQRFQQHSQSTDGQSNGYKRQQHRGNFDFQLPNGTYNQHLN